MEKIIGIVVVLNLILVSVFWFGKTYQEKVAANNVIQTLEDYGFEKTEIIGQKSMTIFSKRARVKGLEFRVLATKNQQTELLFVFRRNIDGSMMFFKENKERIFFK